MALRLRIVSHHVKKLGQRSVKQFGAAGGTIGRSLDCNWTLPDGQRYVSSRHASIDFRSGSYYIIDTSTNGVYVNEAEQPVGRGKPQRLFDGDRIRLGEYEMQVEIDDEAVEPLIEEHHVDPVDLAQRVEAPQPVGEDMVDAYEITGVGMEMLLTDDELESLTPPSKKGYFGLELEGDVADEMARTKPHLDRRPPRPREAQAAPAPAAGSFANAGPRARSPNGKGGSASVPTASPRNAPSSGARPAASSGVRPAASSGVRPAGSSRSLPAASPASPPAASTAPRSTALASANPTPSRSTLPASRPDARSAADAGASADAPREWKAAAKTAAAGTGAAHVPQSPARRPRPTAATPHPAAARPAPANVPTASAEGGRAATALEPFFRGAGIDAPRIDAQQADAVLLTLGQLMREMIAGVAESLHVRAEQKNALRLPSTTIQAQDNNPLKFSAGVEETMLNLLLRDSQQYLPPVEAVREAFADIKLHQRLLLKALQAALERFVARLDPDELEQKFARGRGGRLMGAANKLKYWDLYRDLYEVVAHHPHGELPMQFLDDFAHAYERELERPPNGAGTPPRKAEAI